MSGYAAGISAAARGSRRKLSSASSAAQQCQLQSQVPQPRASRVCRRQALNSPFSWCPAAVLLSSLCSVTGSLLSHCSCRSRRPLDLKVAAGRLPQHLRHHASPGLLRLHADHWVHLHGLSSESGLQLACATAWRWRPPLAFKIAISGQVQFSLAPVRLLPGCGFLALISLLCCVCHGSSAWQEALPGMMLSHFPRCKRPMEN